MAAIEAGKRGRRVGVLEHADRTGKKILISGGGRCNFTNLHCQPDHFLSANPHFVKSALARYTPADFIALVEKHRIAYHEKTLGQLFCDRSAQEIVSMLEEECRAAAVQIFTKTSVHEVARPDDFVLRAGEHEFHAPVLVVATGGLSIPKMGATGIAYDIARQFGLCVRECRPALVPLLFNAKDRERYCDLTGVSAEVTTGSRAQAIPGKNAGHASRPERSGDSADFLVLGRGRTDRYRPRARPGSDRAPAATRRPPRPRGVAGRVSRRLAESAG